MASYTSSPFRRIVTVIAATATMLFVGGQVFELADGSRVVIESPDPGTRSFDELLAEFRATPVAPRFSKDITAAKDTPALALGPADGIRRRALPFASRARS